MPFVLAFAIAGLPKLQNQLLRGHWRVKHAHAVKWKAATVRAVFLNGGAPSNPLTRVRLTCVRVSSVEPDYDGLVSSFKPIWDGLVECGVLASDKRSVTGTPEYLWEKGRQGHGQVRVRVEEIK